MTLKYFSIVAILSLLFLSSVLIIVYLNVFDSHLQQSKKFAILNVNTIDEEICTVYCNITNCKILCNAFIDGTYVYRLPIMMGGKTK